MRANNVKKLIAVLLTVVYLMTPLQLGVFSQSARAASGHQPEMEETGEVVEAVAEGVLSTGAQPDFGITAKSALLMEASTGTVIYALNPDEQLSPASITKIMTLILIFEALDAGRIKLTDPVTTSAYAKSMGGSQVFLEEGEVQSVETMIKCIVVASANDASVAMAEHLAGSESEFIRRMNEKAAELGMTGTHFEDCCGLTDSTGHYTTAKDVAIMSRELITKHPEVKQYTTIWMENITHVTNKGSSEFGLANTNKLLKMSTSFKVTGLKTGSTSRAKYCLSATAEKDGIELIAVIMASENYKLRFSEAQSLLNYGYSNCELYWDDDTVRDPLPRMKVQGGVKEQLSLGYDGKFSYLMFGGQNSGLIEKQIVLEEYVEAPITENQKVGSLNYLLDGKLIGSVDIVAKEAVEKAGFWDYFSWIWRGFWLKKIDFI
ncbi:MAG: D-alanyl-D-alanine carboxypeptidase [Lachnospiraceae bacterium]|nr:D-alanyl-D-alanine carboxypeptidase [Lachnospiraceae bacterium]